MSALDHAPACTRPPVTVVLRSVNGRPHVLLRCPECGSQRLDPREVRATESNDSPAEGER